MEVSYKEFYKMFPKIPLLKSPLADWVCYWVSPYISVPCIRKDISANFVTLLMVLSGLIGSILFFMPFVICKILGAVAYFMWFVFDCADGPVARYTKRFSRFGREFDWVAHLICHSSFIVAVYYSFLQYSLAAHESILLAMSFLILSIELITRWDISFCTSNNLYGESSLEVNYGSSLISFFRSQLYFPNLVVFLPILFIINIYISFPFVEYVYYIFIACYSLVNMVHFIRTIKLIYNS